MPDPDTPPDESPGADRAKAAVSQRVEAKFSRYTSKNRSEQLERGYIGSVVRLPDRIVVVVDPAKVDEDQTESDLSAAARDARQKNPREIPAISVDVVPGCFSSAALLDAQKVIEGRTWHPRAKQITLGWYLDASDSRYHVSIAAKDADVADALDRELGDRVVLDNDVPVPADGAGDARRGDVTPHYGAASIRRTSVANDDTACTVGPTIVFTRNNPAGANGTRGMLGAGHCYNDGQTVESANTAFGTVYEDLLSSPNHDGLFVNGTATSGNYATDNVWANGRQDPFAEPTSTEPGPLETIFARDVEGQFNIAPTNETTEMCVSGRVSGNTCDGVIEIGSYNACFASLLEGCAYNLFTIKNNVATNRQMVAPGDSGGPVYVCINDSGGVIATGAHGGRWCNGEGAGGGTVPDPADKRAVKIVGIVSFDRENGRGGISRIEELQAYLPFAIGDFD